jgi:spoIIIJ-associated protein
LATICEDTEIAAELQVDQIVYDVKGGNPAVLIGKRGQTLEAVQYLVDKMVNQQRSSRIRVVVDVEGYWENRRNSLRDMAKKMAEKAKQSQKPITLGQMNAHDRRIVHLALKADPSVKTQSRGEGFFRKLVIFPRKEAPQKPKEKER